MKNLKQLGLFLSIGTVAMFSIGACGDDTPAPTNTAGAATAGTGTAGTGTAGTGTAGTGTAGTGTAGTGTAGTGTAGTGTAGTATSGGGGAGGTGGGSGGKAGAGGTGGSGGAAGGGGSGGGGAGAPSADCTKWCSGAMGVVTFCAGKGLAPAVDSEAKCIAHCTKKPESDGAMGLACWNTHLANAITGPVGDHCKHASGAQDQAVCNKTTP